MRAAALACLRPLSLTLSRNTVITSPIMFTDPCSSCGKSSFCPKELQPARQERVETLLKGNEAPLDSEKVSLKVLLREGPPMVCRYDEKIALLRTRLQSLVDEREKLQLNIDDAQKLLHPIRSMPDDILREIFSHCVPRWADLGYSSSPNYSSLNSSNAPWVLSHVSSRWRRLALSSPSLWSTLACTLPRSTQTMQAAKFSYNLALFLSRSKDYSICVFLQCDDDFIAEIQLSIISITLQVSASRWTCLRFDAQPCLISVLSTMCFERLEVLDIRPASSQFSGGPVEEPFRLAPRLREVIVRKGELPSRLSLPWAKIRVYDCVVQHLTMTEGARLQSMSQLERLILHDITDRSVPSPVSLSRLKYLHLVASNPAGLALALPMFTMPLLERLSMNFHPRSTQSQPRDKFLFPSNPTIMQRITLLSLYFQTDILSNTAVCSALIVWLQEASNVDAFALWHGGEIPNALLESLVVTPTENNGVLLPRLKQLRLHNLLAGPTAEATVKMASILNSRKAHRTVEVKEGTMLRKVEVLRLLTIQTDKL